MKIQMSMNPSNDTKAQFKHKYKFSYFLPASKCIYLYTPYDESSPLRGPPPKQWGGTSELSFKEATLAAT